MENAGANRRGLEAQLSANASGRGPACGRGAFPDPHEYSIPVLSLIHIFRMILEKPAVQLKLGFAELTPRSFENYAYLLRLDLWDE